MLIELCAVFLRANVGRKKKAPIGSRPKLVAPGSGWRLPDAGRKLREQIGARLLNIVIRVCSHKVNNAIHN
jgi:hypothetical protein